MKSFNHCLFITVFWTYIIVYSNYNLIIPWEIICQHSSDLITNGLLAFYNRDDHQKQEITGWTRLEAIIWLFVLWNCKYHGLLNFYCCKRNLFFLMGGVFLTSLSFNQRNFLYQLLKILSYQFLKTKYTGVWTSQALIYWEITTFNYQNTVLVKREFRTQICFDRGFLLTRISTRN